MLRQASYLLVLAFAASVTGCGGYGEKLQVGSGEVYYTDGATEAEAQKLGDWLKENGYFADDGVTRSVQVRKEGDVYQVRFVVQEDAIDQAGTAEIFRALGDLISADVFGGAPVEVHLTDEYMETQHVLEETEAPSE